MNDHRTLVNARTPEGLCRRAFLGVSAVAAASVLLPARVLGEGVVVRTSLAPEAPPAPTSAVPKAVERTLSFLNLHTGERLKVPYCRGGEYLPDGLKQIDHILRDHRANEVKAIDPKLLDLLHELSGTLEVDQPYHVISGYRSPNTNGMLRASGGGGVATGSLHLVGKAIDIRLPGVKLDNLRAAARTLKLGGVGYYPNSNFVHVDTGRVRFW